jgi:Putative Ig domain
MTTEMDGLYGRRVWTFSLVVFLFLPMAIGLLTVAAPAEASDVVFVDHGSVYDPPASSDKAYYPSVLYDESQFSGHGASHYYKMWYADAQGQFEAVTYSNDGISWSSPVQTTGIVASGYHAKVIYIPSGYSGAGGTYYYKIWYWDSSANVYSINALRTADSTDGENWQNDQVLTQDAAKPLVTGDPSNWSAGSYGPVTILDHPSATNAGPNPFDYTFSMYYDVTTGGQEAVALAFSIDGNHWMRYGSAPVLPHGSAADWDSDYASHGTVIKGSDGVWRMWYSGSGPSAGAEHGIGYATSADGINWTKDPGNPIFSIDQAVAWRSSRCYTPSVIYRSTHFDGHGAAAAYKMWFTGEAGAGGNRTIGYADAAICPTITVSPAILPSLIASIPYSQTIIAGGGTAPYTYSVTSGSLPGGITLSSTGLLSGQAISAGTFTVTITATDSNNCAASQAYTLDVVSPVPALPEWGLLLLAGSVALVGCLTSRE